MYELTGEVAVPCVLILSRFAGAAHQLQDALLVNPHSCEDVSEAIGTALAMPKQERIRRWEAMMENVRHNDVVKWREDFVRELFA